MTKPQDLFDIVKEELNQDKFYLWLYYAYSISQTKFTDDEIEALEHHFKILREDQKKEK